MNKWIIMLLLFTSCTTGPRPIVVGKDQCENCKMVIADDRFGTELLTKKHKIYKFDDVKCMIDFIKSGSIENIMIDRVYLVNYNDKSKFIDSDDAVFLTSPNLHSPMNGNTAAFVSEEEASLVQGDKTGEILRWSSLYNKIR